MKKISIAMLSLAISFSVVAVEKIPFTVRDLVTIERVSAPTLSPKGNFVVFAVRQVDLDANTSKTGLWLENLMARDAMPPIRFTDESLNVNSPSFSPDGKTVYFLSAKSGTMQLWSQALDGKTATKLSNFDLDIGAYKLSPDGKSIALSFEVFNDCADLACTKKRIDEKASNKASGLIYDKLFIRHWDTWADGRRNQLYVAPITASHVGAPVKVSRGIDGDVPSKPFGDASEFAWSPDSKEIVFSVRIAGKTEAWSTNFDLYHVAVAGKSAPQHLTASNLAWDTAPLFSPDGKTLYYTAMSRPGFEADRFAIMALDLATGKKRELAPNWDRSAGPMRISTDGQTLYTTTDELGQHPLFAITIASGMVKEIAGNGTVGEFDLSNGILAFTRDTLKSPAQLFVMPANGGAERQVTNNNVEKLARIAMGEPEQFSFTGAKGEKVYGYVVKPANYQEGKTYPVAFLIHGGPQGSFGNHFHYRWNPLVMVKTFLMPFQGIGVARQWKICKKAGKPRRKNTHFWMAIVRVP